MSQLPCPNPTCSHVFSHAEVQRAGSLTCPRCNQVFQLRAESPIPAPQAPPAKKPAPRSVPVAVSAPAPVKETPPAKPAQPTAAKVAVAAPVKESAVVKPAVPLAKPIQPAAVKVAAPVVAAPGVAASAPVSTGAPMFAGVDDDGPLVRPRHKAAKWGWKKYTLATFGGLILGALIVTSGFYIASFKDVWTGDTTRLDILVVMVRNLKNEDEKAFKVAVPKNSWTHDDDIRKGFGARIALRHPDGESWVAVTAKDFGTVRPRDAELINEAIDRLKQMYPDSLELGDKATSVQLAGQSAQRLDFKGQFKAVPHRGEAYVLTHNGFGYWLFVAGPTLDDAQRTLEELQANNHGFACVSERRGWREQPPKTEPFGGSKYPFHVRAPEGVWEKFNPLDGDEAGDLYLIGRYLKEKDNRKNASALAMLLPRQESLKDAVKFARSYVEEAYKKEFDFIKRPIKLVEAEGEESEGQKVNVGNRPGRMVELKVLLDGEPTRYMILAVTNEEDRVFVLRFESTWEHRQIWRQDFLDLLKTVRINKG